MRSCPFSVLHRQSRILPNFATTFPSACQTGCPEIQPQGGRGAMSMLACHPVQGGSDAWLIRRLCPSECGIAKARAVRPCTMPIIRTLTDYLTGVLTPPLPLLSSLTSPQFCSSFEVLGCTPVASASFATARLRSRLSRFSAADADT